MTWTRQQRTKARLERKTTVRFYVRTEDGGVGGRVALRVADLNEAWMLQDILLRNGATKIAITYGVCP